jgi:hypothetical protein
VTYSNTPSAKRKEREYAGGTVAHVNDWKHLCKLYGLRCLCCKKQPKQDRLTRDHIIPVGMPGSHNGIDNLQPLCELCNSKKGRRVIDYRPDRSSVLPYGRSFGYRNKATQGAAKAASAQQTKPSEACDYCRIKDQQIHALKVKNDNIGKELAKAHGRIRELRQEKHELHVEKEELLRAAVPFYLKALYRMKRCLKGRGPKGRKGSSPMSKELCSVLALIATACAVVYGIMRVLNLLEVFGRAAADLDDL